MTSSPGWSSSLYPGTSENVWNRVDALFVIDNKDNAIRLQSQRGNTLLRRFFYISQSSKELICPGSPISLVQLDHQHKHEHLSPGWAGSHVMNWGVLVKSLAGTESGRTLEKHSGLSQALRVWGPVADCAVFQHTPPTQTYTPWYVSFLSSFPLNPIYMLFLTCIELFKNGNPTVGTRPSLRFS